ncbi:MAG TPA: AraC family transcriptional regulator, partial [Lacunisphaera sp.]|nr:AraC family transcriptional regulator [Lacunisphaera sp.]
MMFDLAPGQVLFLAPYTWSCPLPEMTYRSLAITLRPEATRVTIHERKAMRKNGTIPWRYLAEWQTSASLGERGEHLLKLLADSAPPRLGRRMYNMCTEILVSEVMGLLENAPEVGRSQDSILWHSLCDYISTHWSDPLLSREKVAEFFNRHPNHISRFFHQHTRQNFRSYVNEIRLKRSLQFLSDLRYNVTDVASLCGFTDLQYFIRCFRQRFGLTPGEYRKQRTN